jgi:hypothetical protein
MFNPDQASMDSFLQNGIRPLSDFPDSERWKQLEEHMPGFYKDLYAVMAEPIIKKPYANSGIFITPIDFRLLPGTFLYDKPRIRIPMERIAAEMTVITYVLHDERVALPFSIDACQDIAATWDEELVRRWFAVDRTKIFFYVPQAAAYQGKIEVSEVDFELENVEYPD